MSGMSRTSLLDTYNALRLNTVSEEITDNGSRIRSLEIQVEHLRALNRALIEYLAEHSNLSPQDFLKQLSTDHPSRESNHTFHCPSCGTLISNESKACYSCGMKVGTDTYILG